MCGLFCTTRVNYGSPETLDFIRTNFKNTTLHDKMNAIEGNCRQELYDNIPKMLSSWKPNPCPKFTGTKWLISLIVFPVGIVALATIITAAMGGPGHLIAGLGITGAAMLGIMFIALTITQIFQYRFLHKQLKNSEVEEIKKEWGFTINQSIIATTNALTHRYGTQNDNGEFEFTDEELRQVECLEILKNFIRLPITVNNRDKFHLGAALQQLHEAN